MGNVQCVMDNFGNEAVLIFPFHTETGYGMCRTLSEVPRATLQRARSSPRRICGRLKAHRKYRALCPRKESQSAFAVHPFIFIKNRVIYHFAGDI